MIALWVDSTFPILIGSQSADRNVTQYSRLLGLEDQVRPSQDCPSGVTEKQMASWVSSVVSMEMRTQSEDGHELRIRYYACCQKFAVTDVVRILQLPPKWVSFLPSQFFASSIQRTRRSVNSWELQRSSQLKSSSWDLLASRAQL